MPIEVTTRGFIEVFRKGEATRISRHSVETEAFEAAINHYLANGGAGLYELRYPVKELDLSRLLRVIDDIAPTVPTNVVGTAASQTQINLTWSSSTDAGGFGLAGYRVYRDSIFAQQVVTTSFNDPGRTPGLTYQYRVSAIDNVGNESAQSSAIDVLAVDVFAPSVPAGLVATAVSSSQINLTWTASTDTGGSGIKDYRIYRDSSLLTTVTSASHSDTGLSASTTYTYRVSARDNALNESAQSSQAQATTQSAANQPPVWQTTIPTQNLVVGVPFSLDLDTLCTDPESQPLNYLTITGALPAGLALDTNTGVISGTPTTVQSVSPTFRASDSTADADWNLRSSGALMRTRFETNGEVLDYRLLDAQASRMTRDTTRTFYGQGSLKFDIPTGDGTSSGNWFRHLNDAWGLYTGSGGQNGGIANATNQGFNAGDVFEVSYALYNPQNRCDFVPPGGGGWKTSIISHDGSSNQSFEVVGQNLIARGYPQGYTTNSFNLWEQGVSTSCSGSDFKHQIAVDRGTTPLTGNNPDTGLPWTPCDQARARYGGLYSYGQSGYPDAVSPGRVWKHWRNQSTPGNRKGPFLYPINDWVVFLIRIEINSYSAATNRVRWWAADRTSAGWELLADLQNVSLPTSNPYGFGNIRFNTLWLLPYDTGRTSGGGVNTFCNYDGVIVKSGAGNIPFPTYWPPVS